MRRWLEGKRVVVTGGGSGIGRATARVMAVHGARVVAADIVDAAASATTATGPADDAMIVAAVCDVRDREQVTALFADAEARLGGAMDVVVNCAGIEIERDLLETTTDDWRRTIDTNVTGIFHTSSEFVRRARATARSGAIVNIASINAFYADGAIPAYCASKGAVLAMTRAMALDHAHEGIRVNCVCPGYVDTPLLAAFLEKQPDPAATRRRAEEAHALGRIGQPEEIARVVSFLASDRAIFMTGAAVVVDGGMTIGNIE